MTLMKLFDAVPTRDRSSFIWALVWLATSLRPRVDTENLKSGENKEKGEILVFLRGFSFFSFFF